MDVAALVIITIGGIIGLYMLSFLLRRLHIPKGLSLIHGLLMALGFVLLVTYNLTTSNDHKHWQSVSIFAVAIVLGVIVLWRDLGHKSKNTWFTLVHGLIGFSGIVVLYLHVLGIV